MLAPGQDNPGPPMHMVVRRVGSLGTRATLCQGQVELAGSLGLAAENNHAPVRLLGFSCAHAAPDLSSLAVS